MIYGKEHSVLCYLPLLVSTLLSLQRLGPIFNKLVDFVLIFFFFFETRYVALDDLGLPM